MMMKIKMTRGNETERYHDIPTLKKGGRENIDSHRMKKKETEEEKVNATQSK